MDIVPFGRHLLESGDLDPVYIVMDRMGWDEAQRNRWLVAYWCCYHPGAACWLSEREGKHFWGSMLIAAHNGDRDPAPVGGRWPRAPERRHWRGYAAVQCVEQLRDRYGDHPEDMVDYCGMGWVRGSPGAAFAGPYRYADVARRVCEHNNFGPWIAYKVADMLERCCAFRVVFEQADAMYDSPQSAAVRYWLQRAGLPETAKPKDRAQAITDVVHFLIENFSSYEAPPGGGRGVGFQEVETILCKWQSHMNGHYPVENDLVEIRHGLAPWAEVSLTAKEFLHHMPLAGQVTTLGAGLTPGIVSVQPLETEGVR